MEVPLIFLCYWARTLGEKEGHAIVYAFLSSRSFCSIGSFIRPMGISMDSALKVRLDSSNDRLPEFCLITNKTRGVLHGVRENMW